MRLFAYAFLPPSGRLFEKKKSFLTVISVPWRVRACSFLLYLAHLRPLWCNVNDGGGGSSRHLKAIRQGEHLSSYVSERLSVRRWKRRRCGFRGRVQRRCEKIECYDRSDPKIECYFVSTLKKEDNKFRSFLVQRRSSNSPIRSEYIKRNSSCSLTFMKEEI